MASEAAVPVTIDELRTFYSIERQLYSRLVIDLNLDLILAMEIISLWLWLEEIGYPNLILKMGCLLNDALKMLVDEAIACLSVVTAATNAPPPPHSGGIPMTHLLLEGHYIDLNYFHQNREIASLKIQRNVNKVFRSLFGDLVQQVLRLCKFSPIAFASRLRTVLPTHASGTGVFHGRGGIETYEKGESSSSKSAVNPIETVPCNPTRDAITSSELDVVGEEVSSPSSKSALNPIEEVPCNPTRDVITINELDIVGEEEVIPEEERTWFELFSQFNELDILGEEERVPAEERSRFEKFWRRNELDVLGEEEEEHFLAEERALFETLSQSKGLGVVGEEEEEEELIPADGNNWFEIFWRSNEEEHGFEMFPRNNEIDVAREEEEQQQEVPAEERNRFETFPRDNESDVVGEEEDLVPAEECTRFEPFSGYPTPGSNVIDFSVRYISIGQQQPFRGFCRDQRRLIQRRKPSTGRRSCFSRDFLLFMSAFSLLIASGVVTIDRRLR